MFFWQEDADRIKEILSQCISIRTKYFDEKSAPDEYDFKLTNDLLDGLLIQKFIGVNARLKSIYEKLDELTLLIEKQMKTEKKMKEPKAKKTLSLKKH